MKKPNKTTPAPKPKLDDFHYFEVMDRVMVIQENWERFVMDHPVLDAHRILAGACQEVERALAVVSSEIGRLNFPPLVRRMKSPGRRVDVKRDNFGRG